MGMNSYSPFCCLGVCTQFKMSPNLLLYHPVASSRIFFFFFFLTYKSWFSLFTLTSKHKRPECSGFSALFLDMSLRLSLVGFGSELLELFGCSL